MENKPSLLQGTTWYWRKSHICLPIHSCLHTSGNILTDELCIPVENKEKAELISNELRENKIYLLTKKIQTSSEGLNEGDLILYMRAPNSNIDDEEDDFQEREENLKKLKNYIHQNGGKIDGEPNNVPIKKFNFFRFLTGGRK